VTWSATTASARLLPDQIRANLPDRTAVSCCEVRQRPVWNCVPGPQRTLLGRRREKGLYWPNRREKVSLAALTRLSEGSQHVRTWEKSHLVIMWTVGPDDVAEGDRIFAKPRRVDEGASPRGRCGAAGLHYLQGSGNYRTRWTRARRRQATRSSCSMSTTSHRPGIARHWQDATDNWPDLSAAGGVGRQGHGGDTAQRAQPSRHSW
jgi:hypothetical protein